MHKEGANLLRSRSAPKLRLPIFDLFQETLDLIVRNSMGFVFHLYGSPTQLTLLGSDRFALHRNDSAASGLAAPGVEHSRASSLRFSC